MYQHGLPALHGLVIWWVSTCLILFLDSLPRQTFRWSMAIATVVLAGAVYWLVLSSTDTSVAGAYTAFTCGVLIWGWLEISFYMGYVTGPRTDHCDAWVRRLASFRSRDPGQSVSRNGGAAPRRDCRGFDLGAREPVRNVDVHRAVVDASEREAERVSGGQQPECRVPAGASRPYQEFLPKCADEPAVSVFGHRLDDLCGADDTTGACFRGRYIQRNRLHPADHLDGPGDPGALVPGVADLGRAHLEQDVAMEFGFARRTQQTQRPLPREATIGGRP